MTVFRIALVTLFEVVRKRLAIVAVVLALLVVALTGLGAHALANQSRHGHPLTHLEILAIASQMMMLVAYLFSMVVALGGAFAAAPALAADIETGLLLPMLTRPIRRAEIVVGKYIGLTVFLAAYATACGLAEFAVVRFFTGYWPPHPFVSLAYLSCVALVMCAIALLFSTRLSTVPSGIAAVVLYGLAWCGGILGDIGANTQLQWLIDAGTVTELVLPSDAFWRASAFALEPASLIAAMHGNLPFVVSAPPTLAMQIWSAGWILVVLGLACWSFKRRDF